jgi:hypothetical protein
VGAAGVVGSADVVGAAVGVTSGGACGGMLPMVSSTIGTLSKGSFSFAASPSASFGVGGVRENWSVTTGTLA